MKWEDFVSTLEENYDIPAELVKCTSQILCKIFYYFWNFLWNFQAISEEEHGEENLYITMDHFNKMSHVFGNFFNGPESQARLIEVRIFQEFSLKSKFNF